MKSNTTTAAKNITRMLSALKKRDCRTAMHFAWTDDQGRQCICDGFRAYRLTEHLPLEDRPADAGEPINLAMLFDPIDLTRYTAINLPSIAECTTNNHKQRIKNFVLTPRQPSLTHVSIRATMPIECSRFFTIQHHNAAISQFRRIRG